MRLIGPLAVALALGSPARAEIERNQFSDREWNVEQLIVPRDWQLNEQRAYPGILVTAVHREGHGRVTLAAERVAGDSGPREYAARTRAILVLLGYKVGRAAPHPSGAYLIEATTPAGDMRLRQGTHVAGGIAYVVTLAAPVTAMPSYNRAFDDVLGHLRLAPSNAGQGHDDATAPSNAPTSQPAIP